MRPIDAAFLRELASEGWVTELAPPAGP